MKRQVGVDRAISQYINFVKLITILKYDLSLLEEFLLEVVDEELERRSPQVFEVQDM